MKSRKLFKVCALLMLAVMSCLLFSGCGGQSEQKKFVITYLPNESTDKNADARKGMAGDLSKVLGMEVTELVSNDYNAVIEAMRTGKADMAYFGPLSFCLAYERAGAEPIGMIAKDKDKKNATYKSVLVTSRKNTDINSIQDIKGKTMAFVDPNSTSGNLIPSAAIMKAFPGEKLSMDDLHTNGKFFQAVSFSGKHQAGLAAVVKGDVQVAPISDAILAAEINAGRVSKDDVKIIFAADPIPSEPMALRRDLPAEVKEKVKNFILSYDNAAYYKGVMGAEDKRFVECSIEDYKGIIDLNKARSRGRRCPAFFIGGSMSTVLKMEHIEKVYGNQVRALHDISLEVSAGEFVAVIGPSGSGKSTLLRTVNQLVVPSGGHVYIDGEEVTGASGKKLRLLRRKVGMIFQHYNLVQRLSVMQNVLHGRLGYMSALDGMLGNYTEEDKRKAIDLLQEIEMGDRLYNRASDLSGGQKQRVGIARAIMQEPKLLLCDEPIASLDPNASKIIMDLIYQMTQRRNIACIVNLHQLDVAMRYATRIIGLAKGEMIFDGTPQQLNNAVIEKIYNTSMENLIIKQGENYA